MAKNKDLQKVSAYDRWLNGIERVGNKLPHPVALFAIFCLLVIVISAVCAALGVSATGDLITHAVSNFTSYAPLGMVLVAMLGVGVAEQSGMINSLLKQTVKVTPKALITPVVVFLGVMSNIASDSGYVTQWPVWPPPSAACPAASPPTCWWAPPTPCWPASPRPPCPFLTPTTKFR